MRSYFNLEERESLAPKHELLPLAKKIEIRLNEAKQLLECVGKNGASFVNQEARLEFNEMEKKIKLSKSNLKSTRLSNLSHLSAIRTVSPH